MRTFIAINLEPGLKKGLIDLVLRLKKKGGNVKWINENSMHLTLKFLGEIDEEKKEKIAGVLEKISGQHHPFKLILRGTGYFPSDRKSPRVIWVGANEEQTLMALQDQLEYGLEKIGFEREIRKFHPHLTLGRVKSPGGIKAILTELENERSSNFGEMLVKKITFFQSTLKPSGAEYTVLSEFDLK